MKELSDYKSLIKILSKHGCLVSGASGKGDVKKVLSLLADKFMTNASGNEFIVQVLAGWTCEELLDNGAKNEYKGIKLSAPKGKLKTLITII